LTGWRNGIRLFLRKDSLRAGTMKRMTMSYPGGDEVRVLHRTDPLAPQRSGQTLPDLAVWTSVPFVAPDVCSHEDTMCAECRRDGWSDYYVEGRDIPPSLR
jgi:hypothetical protein